MPSKYVWSHKKKKSQSPSAHAEHSEMRKFFFFFFGEKLINGARHSKQRILATDHSMHCFNFIYFFNMCAKLMKFNMNLMQRNGTRSRQWKLRPWDGKYMPSLSRHRRPAPLSKEPADNIYLFCSLISWYVFSFYIYLDGQILCLLEVGISQDIIQLELHF
jgi:hypothetical protein